MLLICNKVNTVNELFLFPNKEACINLIYKKGVRRPSVLQLRSSTTFIPRTLKPAHNGAYFNLV